MEAWDLLRGRITGAGTNHDLDLRGLAVPMVPGGMNDSTAMALIDRRADFVSRFAGLSPSSSNPCACYRSSFSCVKPPFPL